MMNGNEQSVTSVATALPAEPLGYFRQTVHPMRRAVKFLAWLGIVLGFVSTSLPVMGLLGIRVADHWMLAPANNTSMWWIRSPMTYGLSVAQLFNAGLLLFISIACLRRWRIGRRGMILHAYAALVLFGVAQFVGLYWRLLMTTRGARGEMWLNWLMSIPAPAINQLIFPVVILVIFRDRSVQEFFEQRLPR